VAVTSFSALLFPLVTGVMSMAPAKWERLSSPSRLGLRVLLWLALKVAQ
jgi:hypothetical protein